MRALVVLGLCFLPVAAAADPVFERAVNGPLRIYQSCIREAGPGACGAHLEAARANMMRLGYAPAQAAAHVGAVRERTGARRPRERAASVAARPTEPKARPAIPDQAESEVLRQHFAEWRLCLDKAQGDVLAFPVRPDMDVEATAGAIARACHGYESRGRDIVLSLSTGAPGADPVEAFARAAHRGVLAELGRRVARATPPRDTASARGAIPR